MAHSNINSRFYLTEVWLENLPKTKELIDCKIVTHILELDIFKDKNNNKLVTLTLDNGNFGTQRVILDILLHSKLEPLNASFPPEIIKGNVIFIHQLQFVSKLDFFENCSDPKKHILVIKSLTRIGYMDVVEKFQTPFTTLVKPQLIPKTFCTHSVSRINESLSSRYWSIDVAIVNRSEIKEIPNSKLFNTICRIRRYMVSDDTGICEIVMFGKQIETYDCLFKIGKVYRLFKFQVAKSKLNYRIWRNQCTIEYDLMPSSESEVLIQPDAKFDDYYEIKNSSIKRNISDHEINNKKKK